MKRLIALVLLALAGFYVAWPAWSGYRIATALTNEDEGLIESKVDFQQVRESLKPAVITEISKGIDKSAGSLGPMAQVVKSQISGTMVDQILMAMITPRSVIRLAKEGGDLAASVQKAMADAGGQLGGVSNSRGGLPQVGGNLGGVLGQVMGGLKTAPAPAPSAAEQPAAKTTASAPAKRSFGLGNIKGFHMAGPFGFDVDVARDATQAKADVTVGMSFTGTDWKLTRVVPVL